MASWSPVHSSAGSASSTSYRAWWPSQGYGSSPSPGRRAWEDARRLRGGRHRRAGPPGAGGSRRARAAGGRGARGRRDRRRGRRGASVAQRLGAGRCRDRRPGRAARAAGARQLRALAAAADDVAALLASVPGRDRAGDEPPRPRPRGRAHVPAGAAGAARPGRGRPARAARSAAVALFAARARARDPQFELTPRSPPPWRRSAGAWTACRWRSSSPPRASRCCRPRPCSARWDAADRPRRARRPRPPKRQQTLRRAFDWSYELLGDEERALLRRLAAFPGGFDIDGGRGGLRGRRRRPAGARPSSPSRRSPASSIAAWSAAIPAAPPASRATPS